MSLTRIHDKIWKSRQCPSHPSYLVSSWLLVASSRVIAVYRPLNINYGPFRDSTWPR